MFESISNKFQSISRRLFSPGQLTEKNIQQGLQEIKTALLEADVNYNVVKNFIENIKEKAVGEEVLKSVSPAQQVIKIVSDELEKLMGPVEHSITISKNRHTTVIMMIGLQGSGKTTSCAKLARYLQDKHGHKPLLVAADTQRPAAIEQLKILGESLEIPVFSQANATPPKICESAVAHAIKTGRDITILDTAGRLHVDEVLMEELHQIQKLSKPDNIFLVCDAMTGQDAVHSAQEFNNRLDIDGVILTKLDGDARGGAALSIKAVTGKPIKFVGTGEKTDRLEEFHPDRMASRILGMGDVVSLVEKAEKFINEEKAQELEQKFLEASFTLEDFLEQFHTIKKMGSFQELLGMLPGGLGTQLQNLPIEDKQINKVEAIIYSMTPEERQYPERIDGRRRARISKGSGTTIQDVNFLLRQFREMRNMMQNLGKMSSMMGMIPGMGGVFNPKKKIHTRRKR
ncbi:MAG: signal recognition particle protein [Planctomycetes bacterium]|jgi:signal recognition particle subunit SRP54|nr:signal recognition particle protein [Planctomycetota bacterium]HNZ65853.1 signal recognition particle protein [Planctomycetota bacterium]HPY75717.1 signal recognition particle protein [Planctomycetota bacterium]HQB01266.1 signal recognition particle protein [Planctomycetota bacterium]HRU51803.1 signal recognition particle protein [Planctomycetota bacterium]